MAKGVNITGWMRRIDSWIASAIHEAREKQVSERVQRERK